jgi:hypothetical protein
MKKSIFTPVIIALVLLISFPMFAQRTGTIIDVMGTRFGDRMWLITYPGTTQGFDNGWDGYKMFGSSLTPQIFVIGTDGNYQIATVSDAHNSKIGFMAGEDTQYTLTITNYDLNVFYEKLYLVDLVENVTIDIYNSGTTYTFTSKPGDPVHRFNVVTSLGEPEVPVVEEPVVEEPETPVVEEPVVEEPVIEEPETPVVEEPVVVEPETPVVEEPVVEEPETPVVEEPVTNTKGKGNDKPKKVKITNTSTTLTVENSTKHKGNLRIVDAKTGKAVKNTTFNADGITTLSTDLKKGVYAVSAETVEEIETTTIVVQ